MSPLTGVLFETLCCSRSWKIFYFLKKKILEFSKDRRNELAKHAERTLLNIITHRRHPIVVR